jgi:ATP-dependent Clp protease ATP-binding subunit ClpC
VIAIDRITDRARRVIELAEDFAATLGEPSVEAEHLLFGLAAEGGGLAAHALKSFGADANAIRDSLRSLDSAPPSAIEQDLTQLQQWALDEAFSLNHNYVGTEHLLLALTRVTSGRCLALLTALRLDCNEVRQEVYSILGHIG